MQVRTELRGLADGPDAPLTLVVASRSPLRMLFPDSPTMTSPLAGICGQYNVPHFRQAEAEALVEQYLSGSGYTMPSEIVAEAWKNSRCRCGRSRRDRHFPAGA